MHPSAQTGRLGRFRFWGIPVRTQRQGQQTSRTLFAALRAVAGPLSLSVVIVMMTTILSPVMAFAAQQNDNGLFICRPAVTDETPADPVPPPHTCPCPGLCGIGGPAFIFNVTSVPASAPPVDTIAPDPTNDFIGAGFRNGLRPYLRGPPQVFESL